MIFTGKVKDNFERWYFENYCTSNIEFDKLLPHQYYDIFDWFYSLKLGFQIGVYSEWLESIGIFTMELFFHADDRPKWGWNLEMKGNLLSDRKEYDTRQIMYKSVFSFINSNFDTNFDD